MEFSVLSMIGEGANSSVFLARDEISNNLYALKVAMSKTNSVHDKVFRYLRDEANALSDLDHPNVIKLHSHHQSLQTISHFSTTPFTKGMFLVLEYAPHGDLFEIVQKFGKLKEKTARYFFKGILSGLQYLHEAGYAHRDLKLQNVLLDQNYVPKIADLGFAFELKEGLTTNKVGSIPYVAPEIFIREHNNPVLGDIFSLGVILFILNTGFYPFESAMDDDPHYQYIAEGNWDKFWSSHEPSKLADSHKFSPSFKSLFEKLTDHRAGKRISLRQATECEWMKGKTASAKEIKEEMDLWSNLSDQLVEKYQLKLLGEEAELQCLLAQE